MVICSGRIQVLPWKSHGEEMHFSLEDDIEESTMLHLWWPSWKFERPWRFLVWEWWWWWLWKLFDLLFLWCFPLLVPFQRTNSTVSVNTAPRNKVLLCLLLFALPYRRMYIFLRQRGYGQTTFHVDLYRWRLTMTITIHDLSASLRTPPSIPIDNSDTAVAKGNNSR